MLDTIRPLADHLFVRGVHDIIADLSFFLMSMAQAGFQSPAVVVDNGAVSRCRAVLAALFGEPDQRPFDVKFWDDTVDRGKSARAPFTLVLNRPAALRRML